MPIKKHIDVILQIDTREKRLDYIKDFKFDKSYGTDRIKISGYEIVTIKTGDIGFKFSLDGGETFNNSNLRIEIKQNEDIFNTLYSSWVRFKKELLRVIDEKLIFYIVCNWGFTDIKGHIKKLQLMKKMSYKTQPFKTFEDRYIDVVEKVPIIQTDNIGETIRRIIKKHIVKNKLQYL
jgi:hypothetical protein